MNDNNIGLDSQSPLIMWAVWDSPQDVLLTPSQTHRKPFKAIHVNWIIQVHFKFLGNEKLTDVYQQILKYVRPGDFIIFVVSTDQRQSQGDNRETRFEFGTRQGWALKGRQMSLSYDINDIEIENLINKIQDLLLNSKVEGVVHLIRDTPGSTIGEQICKIGVLEKSDLVILKRNKENRSMIVQVAKETLCSIVIIK